MAGGLVMAGSAVQIRCEVRRAWLMGSIGGAVLNAMGCGVLMAVPGMLAATWFKEKEKILVIGFSQVYFRFKQSRTRASYIYFSELSLAGTPRLRI